VICCTVFSAPLLESFDGRKIDVTEYERDLKGNVRDLIELFSCLLGHRISVWFRHNKLTADHIFCIP
jgi:hypothetical protein